MVTYGEGQQVMVKNPAFVQGGGPTKKLLHTWTGPFRVIRRMGETTYLVEGVNGEGRAVSSNRLKLYHSSAHPEGDPADYAHHFEDAGEGHPGEGNRTYEPTMTEQQMAAAEEEAKRKQLEDPGGALGGDDAANSSSEEEDSWGSTPNLVETSEAIPAEAGVEESKAEAPPVEPDGGLLQLCRVCHQPRRGHICPGVYQPVRQTVVNRRRLGRAHAEAPPLFGILNMVERDTPTLYGVYARNDRRKETLVRP